MTFLGETEHFSGKNGALRWSILVGKQKHVHGETKAFAFEQCLLLKTCRAWTSVVSGIEFLRQFPMFQRICLHAIMDNSAKGR